MTHSVKSLADGLQTAEQNGVAAKEAEKLFKRLALKKQKK
jgi:hypothetical protein